jgi:hypothetical protein
MDRGAQAGFGRALNGAASPGGGEQRRGRLVFEQMAPGDEPALRAEEQPDQILTVEAERPLEVAQRAVRLANDNGLRANLALAWSERAEEEVQLELSVPPGRYEDFLFQVSRIAPPENQRFSNTAAAEHDSYFRDLERRYRGAQRVAGRLREQAGEREEKAPEADIQGAAAFEEARILHDRVLQRPAEMQQLEREHRARAVRLLIRLVRSAEASQTAPLPPGEEQAQPPPAAAQ